MAKFNVFLVTLVIFSVSHAEEPHCSKFDFEEKVLEKMVRMEFQMERLGKEISESVAIVKNLEKSVDNNIATVNKGENILSEKLNELTELKENFLQSFKKELSAVKERTRPVNVVFQARSVDHMPAERNRNIIFPKVLINIGDGYDVNTGVFTAPVNGTYIFTVAFCLYNGKYLNVGLMVDGTQYSAMSFYGDSGNTCHSADGVAVLTTDERVYIEETGSSSSGNVIYHQDRYRWSTFSGVLVNV